MVKVERTFPAPASLKVEIKKASGSYSEKDVTEQLKKDFHDKCYVCELKGLQDPEVEHRLPHKNGSYLDRKFDWSNLFWSCGHCNGVKMATKYDVGIIDCCKADPEELIRFGVNVKDVEAVAKVATAEAELTAELVNEVFNLRNTGIRIHASAMRFNELNKEMNKLFRNLQKAKRNPGSKAVLRKLKALLRRESEFAAFKRNYIRENAKEYEWLL